MRELEPALVAREAEVHVVDVDGAIDVVVADPEHAVEHAAPLLEPDREIDVRALDDRIARQDRVAVLAAAADVDVGEPGAVAQAELLAEQVDLVIVVRARAPASTSCSITTSTSSLRITSTMRVGS